jgi:hypothetical protein
MSRLTILFATLTLIASLPDATSATFLTGSVATRLPLIHGRSKTAKNQVIHLPLIQGFSKTAKNQVIHLPLIRGLLKTVSNRATRLSLIHAYGSASTTPQRPKATAALRACCSP